MPTVRLVRSDIHDIDQGKIMDPTAPPVAKMLAAVAEYSGKDDPAMAIAMG